MHQGDQQPLGQGLLALTVLEISLLLYHRLSTRQAGGRAGGKLDPMTVLTIACTPSCKVVRGVALMHVDD